MLTDPRSPKRQSSSVFEIHALPTPSYVSVLLLLHRAPSNAFETLSRPTQIESCEYLCVRSCVRPAASRTRKRGACPSSDEVNTQQMVFGG